MTCTAECWTPTDCPHGDRMTPRGRSAPMDSYVGCECYADSTLNRRHLWSAHDSDRYYADPAGWAAHEAGCYVCGDPDDDE